MRCKEYLIDTYPMPWIDSREAHPHRYMDNKEYARTAYQLSIIRDHHDEDPFEGPVHLEVEFYVKLNKLIRKRSTHINSYGFPTTDSLVRFLIHAIDKTNLVLLHRNQISAITARQYTDKKPRISFRLSEMS